MKLFWHKEAVLFQFEKKNGDNNLEESLARLHVFWKISFPRESEKWNIRGKHKHIVITIWSGSLLNC